MSFSLLKLILFLREHIPDFEELIYEPLKRFSDISDMSEKREREERRKTIYMSERRGMRKDTDVEEEGEGEGEKQRAVKSIDREMRQKIPFKFEWIGNPLRMLQEELEAETARQISTIFHSQKVEISLLRQKVGIISDHFQYLLNLFGRSFISPIFCQSHRFALCCARSLAVTLKKKVFAWRYWKF